QVLLLPSGSRSQFEGANPLVSLAKLPTRFIALVQPDDIESSFAACANTNTWRFASTLTSVTLISVRCGIIFGPPTFRPGGILSPGRYVCAVIRSASRIMQSLDSMTNTFPW